jgi:Fe-Mn family superoxide dismutase
MYEAKNYSYLLGLSGFSEALLANHFGLYEGYVKNTNALMEKMREISPGSPEYAELRRRFGWEYNGMRLHELYFSNITKEQKVGSGERMREEIVKQWGSFENWEKDFIGVGAMRGIGWTILYRDADSGKLFNAWINEHDAGHLAGATPLLVMDVFEHAFVLDYGMKRPEYIEAFMRAVDWEEVDRRLSA